MSVVFNTQKYLWQAYGAAFGRFCEVNSYSKIERKSNMLGFEPPIACLFRCVYHWVTSITKITIKLISFGYLVIYRKPDFLLF